MVRVVLIEDDPMVLEVNKQFVEQVPGFEIVGTASNGLDGIEKVRSLQPDLVFLDIYMPGQNGTEVLQQIRNEQLATDAIVITAASDIPTVQRMLHQGAVDYIVKPFKFERVKEALENYRAMKKRLNKDAALSQSDLDQILHGRSTAQAPESVPGTSHLDLPKGLQEVTMKQVMQFLRQQQKSLSAEEVAEGVGLARVTARRYLEFLEKSKQVKLDLEYGGIGRPVNRYVWVG
ncbi:response regulator [Paenibacillus sedimenti]|uniref:Transcriptional regulatory protein n=1 Tax=Paenibacillus sedimenti TaxID=2770274 RepID=A0A926KUF1_9BACL|nr:response regulator [Paenibacillus sedimenti]MBD0383341.1 response regulator [Paenibacillus sedimenti]